MSLLHATALQDGLGNSDRLRAATVDMEVDPPADDATPTQDW